MRGAWVRRASVRGAWVLVTVLLVVPQSLSAQRAWEVAGGYAYLQDPPDRTNFPAGWIASAGVALNDWLSAVADVSRSTESSFAIDLATSAFVGGARASARVGPFTEFGQLLAGVARATSTVVGISQADEHFALQPGGGLDYPLGRRLAARLQIDYRAIAGGIGKPIADPRHQLRYAAELVYRRR